MNRLIMLLLLLLASCTQTPPVVLEAHEKEGQIATTSLEVIELLLGTASESEAKTRFVALLAELREGQADFHGSVDAWLKAGTELGLDPASQDRFLDALRELKALAGGSHE